jgi:hypothetical protein
MFGRRMEEFQSCIRDFWMDFEDPKPKVSLLKFPMTPKSPLFEVSNGLFCIIIEVQCNVYPIYLLHSLLIYDHTYHQQHTTRTILCNVYTSGVNFSISPSLSLSVNKPFKYKWDRTKQCANTIPPFLSFFLEPPTPT